jgi:hypothetical protein
MCDHCLSERNTSRIPSFSQQKKQKAPQKSKNLSETTYETASMKRPKSNANERKLLQRAIFQGLAE